MRRLSIAKLMLVVAGLAVNFAAIHLLFNPSGIDFRGAFLVGLLPLADAAIFFGYRIVSRGRVAIRRRRPAGEFARPAFASAVVFLAISVALILLQPAMPMAFLDAFYSPFEGQFDRLGIASNSKSTLVVNVVIPALVWVAFSGPPLLAVLAIAIAWSRFEVVFTPHAEQP